MSNKMGLVSMLQKHLHKKAYKPCFGCCAQLNHSNIQFKCKNTLVYLMNTRLFTLSCTNVLKPISLNAVGKNFRSISKARSSDLNMQSSGKHDENCAGGNEDICTDNERLVSKTESRLSVADQQDQLINNMLESKLCSLGKITNDDWNNMKSSILETSYTIHEENIDSIILNKCSALKALELGKSYFKYLKSTGIKINRATYGNYLRLFYNCSSDCTEEDLKEIDIVYKELLQVYPLLDFYTAEKAVYGLSITSNWREYEKLFKDMKVFYNPTSSVYAVVIKSAFKNNELELGWKLIEDMQFLGIPTPDDVFISWLEIVKYRKNHEDLLRLLNFFYKFNIKPSEVVCVGIKQIFEKSLNKGAVFTEVSRRGECWRCKSKLEPAHVSREDYTQLKDAFLNPTLIGKDIFQRTHPGEIARFQNFLESTAPYDVVLDGLNIAFQIHKKGRTQSVMAHQLMSVVKHFIEQNQKVAVIGRNHIKKWPSQFMQYVFNKAAVFLADDISQDDPFMLYTTLYSGLGTRFVSADLMRGHKFLLNDQKLQATFQKWQAQHQYFVKHIQNNGIVHLQYPVPFMQTIQQNAHGDWHIPCNMKENFMDRDRMDNFHKHWLCLVNDVSRLATNRNEEQRAHNQWPKPKMTGARPFKNSRPLKEGNKTLGINLKKIM